MGKMPGVARRILMCLAAWTAAEPRAAVQDELRLQREGYALPQGTVPDDRLGHGTFLYSVLPFVRWPDALSMASATLPKSVAIKSCPSL